LPLLYKLIKTKHDYTQCIRPYMQALRFNFSYNSMMQVGFWLVNI